MTEKQSVALEGLLNRRCDKLQTALDDFVAQDLDQDRALRGHIDSVVKASAEKLIKDSTQANNEMAKLVKANAETSATLEKLAKENATLKSETAEIKALLLKQFKGVEEESKEAEEPGQEEAPAADEND
mmetsp:Transcript_44003/g.58382  ORF Transcript_44003/g.58382 Transcript_44003/m.58382 type:complete len:129 (+) Transcript_44003:2305-2691(+)|eukprot:CAMPEP_0185597422 /NCGR_PEP_ID=MMETSP0434-20130131/81357_1 /TAXON_ID=626734 ORGANISM="Favella taraikaensis, Strain Fe Narragansett Bay" /NCGR_SAMPLE_ID=MMETSP0434 /ASSEMBLY_ACC=CAM_ASM_000379 /LENGTH=128 /DNA_ID=CAMNT_0028226143 /DNA_START=2337 /DNA_END=2723 /DNA_ORIENTATION=-